MASKQLFSNKVNSSTLIKAGPANTVNNAGGKAYSHTAENELAQLVVTGTFNNTYYVKAETQLEKILKLANQCNPEFVAKCAIYGHKIAKMKDTPAMLLAILVGRGETALAEKIFPQVISNQKMLRNFVQIIRSGQVGRKSFGTAMKRAIQTWFSNQNANSLFKGSVGNDPSLADVVKMIHPKPENPEKQAFYGWLLDKKYDEGALPAQVKLFERFKRGECAEIPDCDFRMLTPFLTAESWKQVALNLPWNALRMNINTLARHGVFNDAAIVATLNAKLQDRDAVRRSNAFPYQILTTTKAIRGIAPPAIYLALEQAMEYATENVPELNVNGVVVCVDTSGSMQSPVTGERTGATTETSCVDVAALMASCVLRKNPEKTLILPFDTAVHQCHFNPKDSVMQNAHRLAEYGGGGTDCGAALAHLNRINHRADAVIYASDNESWYNGAGASSNMVTEWATYKSRNPKAKLVCVDLTPNSTTQVPNLPLEVMNIGGWSDSCFEIIANFFNNDSGDFAQVIKNKISLDK